MYLQTKSCGWGAEAAEVIKKGEFVIEYVGEGKPTWYPISNPYFLIFYLQYLADEWWIYFAVYIVSLKSNRMHATD